VNNAQGFVADCMDCHLPAPHDTVNFFYAKTWHGMKDIAVHFTQDTYDHEDNREKACASFKNEQCQKCHRNLLYIPEKRGAMLSHRSVVYARPGYAKWKTPGTWWRIKRPPIRLLTTQMPREVRPGRRRFFTRDHEALLERPLAD